MKQTSTHTHSQRLCSDLFQTNSLIQHFWLTANYNNKQYVQFGKYSSISHMHSKCVSFLVEIQVMAKQLTQLCTCTSSKHSFANE